jgi:hypothetical protein
LLVAVGEGAQLREDLRLGGRGGQVEPGVPADGLGDGGVHELVDRAVADGVEHLALFVGTGADMASREGQAVGEFSGH